jgi:hypothetical protein
LLDAVMGMIYWPASDAPTEQREAYREDLDNEDEWGAGIWRTEFEIGGIVVYDTGERVAPKPEQRRPSADRTKAPERSLSAL